MTRPRKPKKIKNTVSAEAKSSAETVVEPIVAEPIVSDKPIDTKVEEEVVVELPKSKRIITVHPANFVLALKRERLKRLVTENPSEDIEEHVARFSFYAPMAACSTGEVPTESEFLKMDEDDVDVWYGASIKVNPHWFEIPEDISEKKS